MPDRARLAGGRNLRVPRCGAWRSRARSGVAPCTRASAAPHLQKCGRPAAGGTMRVSSGRVPRGTIRSMQRRVRCGKADGRHPPRADRQRSSLHLRDGLLRHSGGSGSVPTVFSRFRNRNNVGSVRRRARRRPGSDGPSDALHELDGSGLVRPESCLAMLNPMGGRASREMSREPHA